MARLKDKYRAEVAPALKQRFEYKNVMEIPRLEKIVINMGLGDCKDNAKALELAVEELTTIAGQKPLVTKAKKSIANFKLRAGMNVGAKVTLRGDRMYEFADKLVSIVLPRVRDFRGVSTKAFDGRGNYSLGVREQLIFPGRKDPRHGDDLRHHRQDRRGSQGTAPPSGHAVPGLIEGGNSTWLRQA